MTGPTTNRSTRATNPDDGAALQAPADTRREDRRETIVAAAARVFEARGLDGASMRLIAREAGCTTGAIYPHFGGKEALYAEVLARSLRTLFQRVRRAAREAPPRERGAAALQAFYDYYRGHPLELSLGLYLYQGARPVGLNRELDRCLNRSLQSVFRLITDALADSGHPQPSTLATAGVAHAVGLLILHQTERLRILGNDADGQMAYFLRTLPPAAGQG